MNQPLDFSAVFADFDALLRGALVSIEVTAGALLVAASSACWSAWAGSTRSAA